MKQIKTNKDKDKKPSKHELLGSLSSICNMLVIGESNSKRETNQCADRLAKSRTKLEQDFVVYGSPLDLLFYDLSGIYFERLMPYSVPFVSFILIPDLPKKNLANQKRNVSNWKQFSIIKFLAFHKQIQHYLLLFPTQKKIPKLRSVICVSNRQEQKFPYQR